jgi:hypothetical protein
MSRKSRPTKKTGARVKVQSSVEKQENRALKSFKKSSPPAKPNTGLRPVIDETEEGTFTVMVGGQQRPKKTKAAFVPMEIDETTPGESMGIVGVSIPPKKATRQKT